MEKYLKPSNFLRIDSLRINTTNVTKGLTFSITDTCYFLISKSLSYHIWTKLQINSQTIIAKISWNIINTLKEIWKQRNIQITKYKDSLNISTEDKNGPLYKNNLTLLKEQSLVTAAYSLKETFSISFTDRIFSNPLSFFFVFNSFSFISDSSLDLSIVTF